MALRKHNRTGNTRRTQRGAIVLSMVFIISVVALLLALNINLMGYKQAHHVVVGHHSKVAFANAQSAQDMARCYVEQRLGNYFADDTVFEMTYEDSAGRYTVQIVDDGDTENKVVEFTAVGVDNFDAAPEVSGSTRVTSTIHGKIDLEQGGKIYDWSETQATTTIVE